MRSAVNKALLRGEGEILLLFYAFFFVLAFVLVLLPKCGKGRIGDWRQDWYMMQGLKNPDEFYIDKDGFRIHAKLDLPKEVAGEKIPLVIVVHGFTGHMEERHILAVAKAAREAGMATLRVEMYGHGKSDGIFEHHNILDWIADMLYVVDYAKSLPFAGDLYLMGHSQGGLLTMLIGGLKADQLKAIIPLSPAISIREGCREGELFGAKFDPDHIPDSLTLGNGRVISGDYIRTAAALPVEQAIDAFKKPVLIIHGEADESVPVRFSRWAAERYRNAKLVLIPEDTHCYDRHLEKVTEAVKEFLRG